jgi:hypothetical protein
MNEWATLHCHGYWISMVVGFRETVCFVRYALRKKKEVVE